MPPPHPVALVGAGPGHPGLLTLLALERLQAADYVLYDRLVAPRLLEYAPERATLECVEDLAGCHPDRVPRINAALIAAARAGRRVVRLKGGDPFVFGRGGEEGEALSEAGVPFEVVPGVSAALGAGACAGIPLTHRGHASAVAFVTGHEQPGKPTSALDWNALARFPGTLVFYMGLSRLPEIVAALLREGKPEDTPAAAVHRATTPQQRTVTATLATLPGLVREAALAAPSLVLVGPVVALRDKLDWFERRPLFGRRVLVTRPRHQAGEFVDLLEEQGAEAVSLPVVEVREPADWGPVDDVLARLGSFDWLVFTSSNGVHAFVRRLRHTGRDLRALGHLRLAVIGPATGDALRAYHLEPDLTPAEFNSEGLAAALLPHVAGRRVLLARADRGLDLLREVLAPAATAVDQVAVYSQVDAAMDAGHEALARLAAGEIDWVTLTSSNIARGLITALLPGARARIERGELRLATISPRTSAVVRELGLPVAAEAREYTTAGLLAALIEAEAARGTAPAPS